MLKINVFPEKPNYTGQRKGTLEELSLGRYPKFLVIRDRTFGYIFGVIIL